MYDHIFNWKLLKGSHEFPGPNGGTCINEAAIVAAGFEYREISCAEDCPPCFSLPISAMAIVLNDLMPDDMRQELLLPFVTKLSGTADTPAIERQRAEFICLEHCRRVLPTMIRYYGGDERVAQQFVELKTIKEALYFIENGISSFSNMFADKAFQRHLARLLQALQVLSYGDIESIGPILCDVLYYGPKMPYPLMGICFKIETQIMADAIKLGNYPKETVNDVLAAQERLDSVKIVRETVPA